MLSCWVWKSEVLEETKLLPRLPVFSLPPPGWEQGHPQLQGHFSRRRHSQQVLSPAGAWLGAAGWRGQGVEEGGGEVASMTGTTQRRGARNGRPLSRIKVVKGSEGECQKFRPVPLNRYRPLCSAAQPLDEIQPSSLAWM